MPLLLVRHARAGHRESWPGDDDRLRPLDERGKRQAEALVGVLAGYAVTRILSSPARRCLETVEPLADARALSVEVLEDLDEERHHADGVRLVRSLAGSDVAVCGHGGLELALPDPPRWQKGAVFVVGQDLEVLEVLPPPA